MIESVDVVVKQPGHADRVVRLSDGASRMGRAEDNEIVLADVGVSRRHAQVFVSRGEVSVEDLGSGNGTHFNGYRIQSQPVRDGDEIVIDPFVLHFKIRGQERGGDTRNANVPPQLQLIGGGGLAGATYPVTSQGLTIGRSDDRDVVIADPAASRHHCQIAVQGGGYVMRDMGGANGVYVNAVRVRECTLSDGDLIRIGNTEMRFVRGEGPPEPRREEPAPPPRGASARAGSERREASQQTPAASSGIPLSGASPAAAPRSMKTVFAAFVGGSIVLVGLVTVTLFLVVAVVVILQRRPPSLGPQNAAPPRWTLNVPADGDNNPSATLFDRGQTRMQEQDYKGALEDFYRVLDTEPGYPYVDKFAYAAGEYLVHDVLLNELNRQFVSKAQRDAERDQLLDDFREGNRSTHLRAERILKRQYSDDPQVMKALKLQAPPALAALQKLEDEGSVALKDGKVDEASRRFADVLEGTKDPKVAQAALANLTLAQREVARQSAELWARAVLAEAANEKTEAKTLFFQLREAHPSNPSTQFHLDRLP